MKSQGHKEELLAAQVRSILFATWDPLGVNASPRLYDEYDDYIEPLLELRGSRGLSSPETIAKCLARFEHKAMGLDPSTGEVKDARRRAAAAIADLFARWG